MKQIIKILFYLCVIVTAGAIFIGLLYLIVGGLDLFLQYRLYILSKPLTYVVIGVMIWCIMASYLSEKKQK